MTIDLIEGIDPRLYYRVQESAPDNDPWVKLLCLWSAVNSLEQYLALVQSALQDFRTEDARRPQREETPNA